MHRTGVKIVAECNLSEESDKNLQIALKETRMMYRDRLIRGSCSIWDE